MRSLTAIALLLFMLLQAAGHFFVFKILQHGIRQEIKQQIKAGVPEAELVLLKICARKSPPTFQPLEEREFRYDGKMYDVVRQEAHGDTTWYYCISDEKETELFADLDELVKRGMSQDSERQQRVEKLLRLFGLLFFNPRHEVSLVNAVEAMALSNYCFGLKIWIDTPPKPPPEA